MISSGFGILALFSLLSIWFSEDRRRTTDPDDELLSWLEPLR